MRPTPPETVDLAYGKYIQEYQKSAINGASPVGIVVMLYDAAIRFMEQGKAAMAFADYEKQNALLQKAQKIVVELMGSLDMEKGGEVAKNLMSLYTYAWNELIQANIHDKPECVDHALMVFTELRESWVAIDQSTKKVPNESAA
ncbi:MAG TPA: flagellar export chaperone FliS [Fimbriimonadaceae bacterium]|nr:flagellar export chaperone FliS [Fimbriimonadaceae bacterium]